MPVILPAGTDSSAEARVAAVTEQQLAGVATGVGSMPGIDAAEATKTVLGELPDLPHVVELPARGAGADMVGRGAAFLVDMPVDLQPSGWRLVDRPGRDLRRSLDFLARDLDTVEDLAHGSAGPLKLQVTGPWTLAGTVELHYGDKAVSDPGATRDLIQSLAEGVRRHVADMAGRLPGARIVLQLDEPSLPAVLAGDVPTASGFGTLRAVEEQVVRGGLAEVLEAASAAGAVQTVVHCCAPNPPVTLCREAGAAGVSIDLALLSAAEDEALGAAVEAGVGLWLGVVPAGSADDPAVLGDLGDTVRSVRGLWRRLGFAAELLPGAVVLTPVCGLAGTTPAYARAALRRVRESARAIVDDPEG
jgi:methionine synthase II (cobalamin-independent)